ncbi:MAG TPA: metal ABC transporter permease [Verrucomicrobiae bacterium]|nr:metal ABC transporter permease [Verrucomicrobiae bacterium]
MNFDWGVLGAPLAAGLIVSAMHVPLGRRVLERGIIFIDLTIAQVAALGAVLGELWHFSESGWASHLPDAIAAFVAAGLLAWTAKRLPDVQEAIIGTLYVVAASAAVLAVAHNPHGGEHLEELLSGQILWVAQGEVIAAGLVFAPLLAAWALWGRTREVAFYFLFAIAVVASVRVIGVFLVFATLILPALAAHGLSGRRGLALGYAVAATGYGLGLWLSVPLDLPAGPLIVCTLAALTLGTALSRKFLKASR